MSHNFDYESAERSSLVERCKAFEALHSAEHALCMSTFKERDTYRDLCGELIKDIDYAILAINNGFGSAQLLRDAITKAESILGEKNGTSN